MTTESIQNKPQAELPIQSSGSSDQHVWPHRHLLDVDQLSLTDIHTLFETARDIKTNLANRTLTNLPILRGVTVVTLFYEPSTRTRISFELSLIHI